MLWLYFYNDCLISSCDCVRVRYEIILIIFYLMRSLHSVLTSVMTIYAFKFCLLPLVLMFCSHGLNVAFAVPPYPTDRLSEEIDGIKSIMNKAIEQLSQFNTLFLTNLEQKLGSMAASLINLDSNIKNIQERAHVWDTFQLHVAAWNEQINTLDRKVEIINKGQEKIFNIDGKVNLITNIEYNIERIISKLEGAENILQDLSKTVLNRDPLYDEFTSRGVLSTLKTVERKIDKILTSTAFSNNKFPNNVKNNTNDLENRGKLVIRCNSPPIVEELLHDVSSKVDVIFDKISNGNKDLFDGTPDEEDDLNSSGEVPQELKSDSSEDKLLHKVWKKLTHPYKKTLRAIEGIENYLHNISNSTTVTSRALSNCSLNKYDNNYFENLFSKIQDKAVSKNSCELLQDLKDQFQEQQWILMRNFSSLLSSNFQPYLHALNETCASNLHKISSNQSDNPQVHHESKIQADIPSGIPKIIHYDKEMDCNDLSRRYPNGIYKLGDIRDINAVNRDYFTRYCDLHINGGGWTTIQRRGLFDNEALNFSRSWNEYKYGFGSLDKEFWFGNEFLHRLTNENEMVLRVELEDFDGNTAWAEYSTFKIASEKNNYKLTVSGYSGNASDSLSAHNNALFSTYDRDNDEAPPCCPCAPAYGGGWWFYSCFEANLNGIYHLDPKNNDYFRGIIWEHWLGNYSLRKTRMLLKPKYPEIEATTSSIPTTLFPEDP